MSVGSVPNMGNVNRSGKTSHRMDRCGKVAMVRLCANCAAVAWGPTCDGCGARTSGNGAADVRQGSIRHIRSILGRLRATGEISDDAAAKIIAEMLGVE